MIEFANDPEEEHAYRPLGCANKANQDYGQTQKMTNLIFPLDCLATRNRPDGNEVSIDLEGIKDFHARR